MTNVTPIQQPALEDLKNALQVAENWSQLVGPMSSYQNALAGIARLIRHAIEGLSEPNLSATQAGEILLREWGGTPEPQRQLRDTIAGILHAQVSGVVPKTWEVS